MGILLRQGDMVMSSTIVVSMDTGMNTGPLDFQLQRPGRKHSTFGKGSHSYPGVHPARMEMKIVLQEWFARIPDFRLDEDCPLACTHGIFGSVKSFTLVWDV